MLQHRRRRVRKGVTMHPRNINARDRAERPRAFPVPAVRWDPVRIIRTSISIAIIAGAMLAWNRASVNVHRAPEIPASRAWRAQSIDLTIDRRAVNGRGYVVLYQRVPRVRFTLTRPSRDDARTLLAVAGTYTSPEDTVEGYVVLDGRIVQDRERQGYDGAIIFDHGRIDIIATENSRRLTRAFLNASATRGQSLIQVHLLVHGSAAQSFKLQPALPRRALVTFADASPAVVESAEAVDLTTFAVDLAALGVHNAANLDMGAWSEGWYRNSATSTIITLGIPNPATTRQTNWIVFEQ